MRITIEGMIDQRYIQKRPLALWIWGIDDGFLICDKWDFCYGTGASVGAALDDYWSSFIAEFEALQKDEGHLANWLKRELRVIKRYIEPMNLTA